MKVCGACGEELSKESFSGTQWRLNAHQRRCKECVAADRELQGARNQSGDGEGKDDGSKVYKYPPAPEAATCWICFDEGTKSGPLVRDCSCRGDAGHAHITCIVKWAQEQARSAILRNTQEEDYLAKLISAWKDCPNCRQPYQNALSVDIASKFIEFAESKEYRVHRDEDYAWLRAEAHFLKILAIRHQPFNQQYKDECIRSAKECIRAAKTVAAEIYRMTDPIKAARNIFLEAFALDTLGMLVSAEGTREGIQKSLEYYEKSKRLYASIGHPEATRDAEAKISMVKMELERPGRFNITDVADVVTQRKEYDQMVRINGKGSQQAINEGVRLAKLLVQSKRLFEAEKLLTEMVAISRQVHGQEHRHTQTAKSMLSVINKRFVLVQSSLDGTYNEVQLLQYEGSDRKRCRVRCKDTEKFGSEGGEVLVVDIDLVCYLQHTPVMCHALKQTKYNEKLGEIKSYDKKTGRYKIRFEDESLGTVLIKKENIRVLFEFPSDT